VKYIDDNPKDENNRTRTMTYLLVYLGLCAITTLFFCTLGAAAKRGDEQAGIVFAQLRRNTMNGTPSKQPKTPKVLPPVTLQAR
jgi:hypothetical protein